MSDHEAEPSPGAGDIAATDEPAGNDAASVEPFGPVDGDHGIDGATSRRPSRARAATAGVLAGALALGTGELLAGLSGRIPSLVARVGDVVINAAPGAVERWAIDTFGTNDKPALIIGIVVISLAVAAATGIAAATRFRTALTVFGLFGLIGALAAGSDPQRAAGWGWLSAALAALVGIASLRWLLHAAAIDAPNDRASRDIEAPLWSTTATPVTKTRRGFLGAASAAAALGVAMPVTGRALSNRRTAATEQDRQLVASALDRLDGPTPQPSAGPETTVEDSPSQAPADPAAGPTTDAVDLAGFDDIEGLTPVVVPNDEFYRIDTALVVPQLDVDTWRMRVTGMVDNELEFSFDDLLAMDPVEEFVTLSCVSNRVGGDLVGNARWLGVPITRLLEMAGVQPGATQIVGRSVDGWTGGFPTAYLDDPDRVALVAVAMNGEPLPIEHGFPVRLVVAGLYGYVSATKWLQEIELTTLEDFDGYWIPRGWSKLGPVKTQSRIDVPGTNATIAAGPQSIAGVAWAPDRGVDRVQVQIASIDDGEPVPGAWLDAELSSDITDNSWRQWRVAWEAVPGDHLIRVRATDGDGETQTEIRTDVAPDGATGWHTIAVRVT